jgi:hypothetical protein
MLSKEDRIEKIETKIWDAKEEISANKFIIGPITLTIFGIIIMLKGLIEYRFEIGLIIIMLAIVWSYLRFRKVKKLKLEISRYLEEISNIKKEPENEERST